MDIIPTDLATYAGEAKNILRDLQSRNERMFLMTFLVVNFADSGQKLENDLLRAASVAQKYNCSLVRLDFQQEDGFVSALPLGVNRIKIQRRAYHFGGGGVRSLHHTGDFPRWRSSLLRAQCHFRQYDPC